MPLQHSGVFPVRGCGEVFSSRVIKFRSYVRIGVLGGWFLWGVGARLDLCWNISKVREVDLNSLLFYKADQIRGYKLLNRLFSITNRESGRLVYLIKILCKG